MANRATETLCGTSATDCGAGDRITLVLRRLFPSKTAANAAGLTGLSPRACE